MSTRGAVRCLLVLISIVMLAAIVAGLRVIGSPDHQRALRLDAVRAGNLGQISTRLAIYWSGHKTLPSSLGSLVPPVEIKDPVSGSPYVYSAVGGSMYRLCARFDAASEQDGASFGYIAGPGSRWNHPTAGIHCFDLDASTGPSNY